ncbi:dead helicase [Fusarium langsethiae]|uniref:Dead helicase n=1 Tax=Fusarium langsethiae TaxID=179993 RepID=A0A0N0V697_FUSLA|nr:dead helicase [Fusarium langsethiae]GKU04231.1 unnamed protein product [Fusarium langsethiae]GKU18743.1 unnamed protein product [Fusarium langsethiae]
MSQHSPAFAQSATCTIMQMLCVQRSILSTMTLPDGAVTSLACNEIEFDLPETVKGKLNDAITRLHANLTVQGPYSKKFKSAHGAKIGAKVIKLHLKDERALIYVINPLTGERDSAVKKFNSATMPVSALVTSLQLSSFGVKFHLTCHHDIIVERPQNLGTQIQAVGRVWRTNQENEVCWWVLHQRDSNDAFVEAREYRIICAYEILRCYLGQEGNRYSRLRVAWYKMDIKKVRLEDFFYTALARFLFRNPDKQECITPETIGIIAARIRAYYRPCRARAKEQERVCEENMAMFENDNPNDDVFQENNAFHHEPDGENGRGGPAPKKALFDLSTLDDRHDESTDMDMTDAGTLGSSNSQCKRKRVTETTPTKNVARDVQQAKRNKI